MRPSPSGRFSRHLSSRVSPAQGICPLRSFPRGWRICYCWISHRKTENLLFSHPILDLRNAVNLLATAGLRPISMGMARNKIQHPAFLCFVCAWNPDLNFLNPYNLDLSFCSFFGSFAIFYIQFCFIPVHLRMFLILGEEVNNALPRRAWGHARLVLSLC